MSLRRILSLTELGLATAFDDVMSKLRAQLLELRALHKVRFPSLRALFHLTTFINPHLTCQILPQPQQWQNPSPLSETGEARSSLGWQKSTFSASIIALNPAMASNNKDTDVV